MAENLVISTDKRRRGAFRVPAGGAAFSAAGRANNAGELSTKDFTARDKAHVWDSAFHAERGCLSADPPRHPAPAVRPH
jgi:hypothetical protein